jgi:hypothetical protein
MAEIETARPPRTSHDGAGYTDPEEKLPRNSSSEHFHHHMDEKKHTLHDDEQASEDNHAYDPNVYAISSL